MDNHLLKLKWSGMLQVGFLTFTRFSIAFTSEVIQTNVFVEEGKLAVWSMITFEVAQTRMEMFIVGSLMIYLVGRLGSSSCVLVACDAKNFTDKTNIFGILVDEEHVDSISVFRVLLNCDLSDF